MIFKQHNTQSHNDSIYMAICPHFLSQLGTMPLAFCVLETKRSEVSKTMKNFSLGS